MPKADLHFSEYKTMWLFAMFDLPVKTRCERREYARFRNLLLDNGFTQMQYSVYARFCPSEESVETYRKRLQSHLPPDGFVRLLAVTDRQFGKMRSFYGKKRMPNDAPPNQLTLF
jgi:CRISPR-associated protein Cas2